MKRKQLEKNRLDLAYQRRAQQQTTIFLLGTTGLLTFLGTFIWSNQRILTGFFIFLIIAMLCIIWYNKLEEELDFISNKIRNL